MKKILYTIIITLIILHFVLQLLFFDGFNEDFWAGLASNFLTELSGIAITVFIVDKLLDLHRHKEAIRIVKELLGNQFEQFLYGISTGFIHFVTKEPTKFKSDFSIFRFKNYYIGNNEYSRKIY